VDAPEERPLWQLLMEEPADLTQEECFAVLEYYLDTLGDDHDTLLPVIEKYLVRCPDLAIKEHMALYQLMETRLHEVVSASSEKVRHVERSGL
jgi:hypothetical protein